MNPFDAIYTRQSVDRIDSISVESQAEFCKKEVTDGRYRVYSDKGYSGKNTHRPAFQELLVDIESGLVRRVIVYRLDRISRSVLDFAGVIDVFQKHRVDFVSTMEKFDTGTPIGKAMLMIVMIFAQLERETIQQRVIDAYKSRSRRGFYMGGRIPYGFTLKETMIDGVRTKMYDAVESEADVIRMIYKAYSDPQASLGDVTRTLQDQGILRRDGKAFTRNSLRDIIINPLYVKADYRLYGFFMEQGTSIVNIPEDFIGTNGAYLYSGDSVKRKSLSLEGHTLVIAPHEGLVDSETWITCRTKCMKNHMPARISKAKTTWLAGKLKCAHCGYALIHKTYHCKTKDDNRYYLCSNTTNHDKCNFGSIDADVVEEIVFEEIQRRLTEFDSLSKCEDDSWSLQKLKLKERINEIDEEISLLLDKISSANTTVMDYVNKRVSALDAEKKMLYSEIARLDNSKEAHSQMINGCDNIWCKLSVTDKIAVVDSLIDRINATKDTLEIKWRI